MNASSHQPQALDGWDLDGIQFFPSLRKLVIDGSTVRLPPKPARVLEMLTLAAPNPATKEDLLDQIWARTFTGDAVVADAIKYLRKATNGAGGGALIETLHKLGYRLAITPVAIVASEPRTTSHKIHGPLVGKTARVVPRFGLGLALTVLTLGVVFAVKDQAREADHQQRNIILQAQAANLAPQMTEADIHYLRGVQHYSRYRPEDNQIAISQFAKTLQFDPDHVRAYAGLSNAYSMQAIKFGGDRHWVDRGVELARQAIALRPGDASGYKALGLALSYYGRLSEAASSYQQALQLFPDYVPAMVNLGIIRVKQGHIDAAIPLFDRALKIAPGAIIARLQMGHAYRFLGMDDLARAWYAKGAALVPGAPADGIAAVGFLLTRGEFENARRLLQDLSGGLPPDAHLSYWRGMTDLYAGDTGSAIDQFTLATAHSPTDSLLWLSSNVRQQLARRLQGERVDSAALVEVELIVDQFLSLDVEDPEYAYLKAMIAIARDDNAAAITSLTLAFEQGWLAIDELEQDPALAAIRNLPDAKLLREQMLNRRSNLISSFSMRHTGPAVALATR